MQRILLVGYGATSKNYAKVVRGLPGMEIAGVAGRNEESVKRFAEENGVSHFGTDIKKVAEGSRATMAIICTPNSVHAEGVEMAASCGLHVLCEKPLHICPEKQNELIDACRRIGVKLGVCYRLRFHEHSQYVKEFIDSGQLGKILVLDTYIKLWRDSSYYTDSSWHGKPGLDGGGPFIQQGSHYIDLAVWFGGGFQKVEASNLFTLLHPIEVEDHGYAVVKYGCGAMGIIEASTICKGSSLFKSRIEITGTKGSIIVGNEGIYGWEVDGCDKPNLQSTVDVFDRQLLDFAEAVDNDREPLVNGEAAKVSVELIDTIYRKNLSISIR